MNAHEMSWFEAFNVVNDFLRFQGDQVEVRAWERFLESPFPHLIGQAAVDGERLVDAVAGWDGEGVEQLLFRLTKVVEQLPRLIRGQGDGQPAADYLGHVVMLWELAALQRVGNMGILERIGSWIEQDDVLRGAIQARRELVLAGGQNGKRGPGVQARPVIVMGQPATDSVLFEGFDEVYQPGYCEECGAELPVDNCCIVCDWRNGE